MVDVPLEKGSQWKQIWNSNERADYWLHANPVRKNQWIHPRDATDSHQHVQIRRFPIHGNHEQNQEYLDYQIWYDWVPLVSNPPLLQLLNLQRIERSLWNQWIWCSHKAISWANSNVTITGFHLWGENSHLDLSIIQPPDDWLDSISNWNHQTWFHLGINEHSFFNQDGYLQHFRR